MGKAINVTPFEHCPPLDGYHCQTNSLAKMFHYYGHPLSEDMLLGLGAGMGFIYWQMKTGAGNYVFIGGRGNTKDFFNDLGSRTGVKINTISTSSAKKAEASLLEKLSKKEPVMLFGDMGLLPWFEFPQEYHFGGHTFVVCGYDGKSTILASDMDQKAGGLKKGFYATITLDQVQQARSSPHKPFPPKNTYLEFDFSRYHSPLPEDIYSALKQTVDALLNPPIKNIGVKGMRHTAKEILKWSEIFSDYELRMNLFTLYIFIEIGGTGGGCFRYMYTRFLNEAAIITKNNDLADIAGSIHRSGDLLSEIGRSFADAEQAKDISDRIRAASYSFTKVADLEEKAFSQLSTAIK